MLRIVSKEPLENGPILTQPKGSVMNFGIISFVAIWFYLLLR